MARFDWVQPEYREWAREIATDPTAAEAALLRLRERMQRVGDAEDQYTQIEELLASIGVHLQA